MRGLAAVTVLGLVTACASRPEPGAAAEPTAAARARVRLTTRVAAPCGPDWLERHATSAADLDGDGGLDRVAIVREGGALVVRLFALPELRETASWRLPDGYVEVATPRRRGTTRGDLWITVGVVGVGGDKPWDGSTASASREWTETLYHLENGALAPVTSGYRDMRIRVDVDGDGRVDPIGSGDAVRALVGDAWRDLPVVLSSHVHGAPGGHLQEEAVDLDGDGVRELVLEQADGVAIVAAPTLRAVWRAEGKPWGPSLVRWGDRLVLVVRLDEQLRVYATDAGHAEIARYPDAASYARVPGAIGSQLAVSGHPWNFYERARPGTSVGTAWDVVARLDDDAAPLGPLRLRADELPGLVVVQGDSSRAVELALVDPATRAVRRPVWRDDAGSSHDGYASLSASLVDLDRDGASELLVWEQHRVEQHHGASWTTSRLRILDGSGALLWQEDTPRTEEWVHEDDGRARQTKVDGTTVRALDLGDGTTALRVRSARDEYYVLAGSSRISAVPACLE